jgi:hypothetical protein
MSRDSTNDQAYVLVLHPADFRGNTLILQGDASAPAPERLGKPLFTQVGRLKTGTFGPCVPVDAVQKTGG